MIKRVLANSAIYGLAPHVPKIVTISLYPVLTAHLTETDFGIAGTIAAYTMAMAAFSTLGFNVVLKNSFYKSPCQYKVLWREIYGFLQFWMIIFALFQSIILYWIIPSEAVENRWLIILFTNFNGVLFGPSALLGTLYYQLNQKPTPIAIRTIVSGLVTALANYLFIVVFKWGYMGWYVGSFIGTFLINSSYWYVLQNKLKLSPICCFKKKTLVKNLKISLPVMPHYYTYFLVNTSNRIVMDRAQIGLSVIGEYNMAQQFSTMMEAGVNSIERATTPMCMSAIKENNENEAKRIIYVFSLLTFFSTFLFSLWSKEIFTLLVRNDILSQTYPYAAILVMALNYRPMYIAASNIYFYHEQTLKVLQITLGAGLLALVANIIFIPIYGIWAAVLINYISFLYQGYSGFLFNTFKKYSKVYYPFIRLLILQLLISSLAFLFLEKPILIKSLMSILFCLIVLLIFMKLSNKKITFKKYKF